MPMSWGVLNRVILLPDGAERWTEPRLQAVLRHELEHVRRRDCLTQAVAEVSLALHWLNPLAWLAARRLRVEREHACDDAVVLGGARPSEYALALMELAANTRPLAPRTRVAAAMIRPVQLNGRLRAILDERRPRGASKLGTRSAGALAVVLVGAVAAFTPAASAPATAAFDLSVMFAPVGPAVKSLPAADEPVPETTPAAAALAGQAAPFQLPAREPVDAATDPASVKLLAQIHGRITDAVTGAPVANAQVRRVGADVVAISAQTGLYALIDVPEGTHELRVERVGYAAQTRSVALTADAVLETDFALTPEPADSQRARVRLREPGNEIRQVAPRPIIYIDGVRVSPPDTTNVLDRLSPDDIERIEVIKGPAATQLYGPDASAGVIQIFLKKTPTPPDTLVLRQPAPNLDSLSASMSVRHYYVPNDSTRLYEPLVFLDGELVEGEQRRRLLEGDLDRDRIERVDVIKGQTAIDRYGPDAHRGVILIFQRPPVKGPAPARPRADR
jgi:hypothetical protein